MEEFDRVYAFRIRLIKYSKVCITMDANENPYRPGAGTKPPVLRGRDGLFARFDGIVEHALRRRPGKSLVLLGLRGVGKTVLLNQFASLAEQKGYSIGHMEARESQDLRQIMAARLRRILMALHRQRPSQKIMRALRILKAFSYQLPDGSLMTLDVEALRGYADSGVLGDDLTDLLVATGEAAADQKRGVLLAVDEIQYLAKEDLGGLIAAIHRTAQLDLPVVLVGAGLPQLPKLADEAKSYSERLFEFPFVDSLSEEDAVAAIAMPAALLGVEFADAALEAIFANSKGYPYFLQGWGFYVWNEAGASPVGPEAVEAAAELVVNHLDRDFYAVRFDRLTPKEKIYLRAMAEFKLDKIRSGDIAARLGVPVEKAAPRRNALIRKGMIYSPGYGETAFTVPMFDDFLRRHMPDVPEAAGL